MRSILNGEHAMHCNPLYLGVKRRGFYFGLSIDNIPQVWYTDRKIHKMRDLCRQKLKKWH